jgi:hypothetical protein
MIVIKKSATADTRSCDFANVTIEQLRESTKQHISDVRKGMEFFACKLDDAGKEHDRTKLTTLAHFHKCFIGGFEDGSWWNDHKLLERHHISVPEGVRDDVNLVDVFDFIVDCVMAGMGRTGTVYPLVLSNELLQKAFQNTVQMLIKEVEIEREPLG